MVGHPQCHLSRCQSTSPQIDVLLLCCANAGLIHMMCLVQFHQISVRFKCEELQQGNMNFSAKGCVGGWFTVNFLSPGLGWVRIAPV